MLKNGCGKEEGRLFRTELPKLVIPTLWRLFFCAAI